MMIRLKYTYTVLSLLLVLLPACDQSDPTESNARITEDGVDGVHFGDTMAEVLRKLGPPTSVGFVDGSYSRSWKHLTYRSGAQNRLTIYFTETIGEPDSLAPADLFAIFYPFPGKTEKGIGIGSTVAAVRNAYGSPLDSLVVALNNGGIHKRLYYCMGKRDLEVSLMADTVLTFSIGFNEPLPGFPTQCSE